MNHQKIHTLTARLFRCSAMYFPRLSLSALLLAPCPTLLGCDDTSPSSTGDDCLGQMAKVVLAGQPSSLVTCRLDFQSLPDAGEIVIDEVDAGPCPASAADAPCTACLKASCCAESLACFPSGGSVCSPPSADAEALGACIADRCSAQCPGIP
jgi:hypothetical protein